MIPALNYRPGLPEEHTPTELHAHTQLKRGRALGQQTPGPVFLSSGSPELCLEGSVSATQLTSSIPSYARMLCSLF